ncbi:MAG: GSCFA domain-containing protein [Aromatoleum sp.]|nr:GSCFA domain-containing protein [Aromatoleum sp.]
MNIPFDEAFRNAAGNKSARAYPPQGDPRCADGFLWPEFRPTFRIGRSPDATVFTIGSCFARGIEEALMPLGFTLPTRAFSVPPTEWPKRTNGLLNEYNPGTMSQRIAFAFTKEPFSERTIVPSGGGYADLLLPAGGEVTRERALERRKEIDAIYAQLPAAPYAIITLGLIETWFDNQTQLFLNRMPPIPHIRASPQRYSFRTLDVSECMALLEKAVSLLVERGIKVILTVSPVPIGSTFSTADCVTANEFSKSVLRVCAELLCHSFRHVDYFPSYEIARSGGLHGFKDDNRHVRLELVHRITDFMIQRYVRSDDGVAPAGAAMAGG